MSNSNNPVNWRTIVAMMRSVNPQTEPLRTIFDAVYPLVTTALRAEETGLTQPEDETSDPCAALRMRIHALENVIAQMREVAAHDYKSVRVMRDALRAVLPASEEN